MIFFTFFYTGLWFALFAWDFIFICSFFFCGLGLTRVKQKGLTLTKGSGTSFLDPNKGLYLLYTLLGGVLLWSGFVQGRHC